MWQRLKRLDQILRGDATSAAALRDGSLQVPVRELIGTLIALAMVYGACMGSFGLLRAESGGTAQWIATTIKVPALFFLTLLVTCPSLYVFNALVGSRLRPAMVLQLLVAALGVNIAVLASLGPIVAFFSISTTSYPFMVLLNVAVFAASGLLGLSFLLQTLQRLSDAMRKDPTPNEPTDDGSESPSDVNPNPDDAAVDAVVVAERNVQSTVTGPLDRPEGQMFERHVKTVFRVWIVIYGLVGAQMGWVLRPFVGDPGLPFEWLRTRESNFFDAVWRSIVKLFID